MLDIAGTELLLKLRTIAEEQDSRRGRLINLIRRTRDSAICSAARGSEAESLSAWANSVCVEDDD